MHFAYSYYQGLLSLLLIGSSLGSTIITLADDRAHAIVTENSARITLPTDDGRGHSFNLEFEGTPGTPRYCVDSQSDVCLAWGEKTKLTVSRSDLQGRKRVKVVAGIPLRVCYSIKGQHLYGGPVLTAYPQEKESFERRPIITADIDNFKIVQAVAERYWFTSSGLNFKVDPEDPLFLSQNKDQICFMVKDEFPYAQQDSIEFSYLTCPNSRNLRDAVKCFFPSYDKPVPPKEVIASPIWSTWVEFKRDIDQEKAKQFYRDIISHGFKVSVMEIDDAWETCYGTQKFDLNKFPDPKNMVEYFHSEGKLVTLWVHPFVGPGCEANVFDDLSEYLLKLPDGSIGKTEWWNGKGAGLVNFNDPKAVNWYKSRLHDIKLTYNFDSFKFDAGEVSYIPGVNLNQSLVRLQYPNQYTKHYVEMASEFGTLAEVRVGAEANSFKLMQRLQDTNSVWEAKNLGLRSVIKSALQLSLLGYGAILPDMVGGNCYENQPTKEMFIRWIQLNTFLPVIQFSLAPWKFDEETVNITRHFTDLHYEYSERIYNEFKDPNHPVINPIWWISPEDTIAQEIDDQFLLGETLLVAPVVREGAVSRDIYLPAGQWKDANTGATHDGPIWLRNYNAPLDLLPYFEAIPKAQ